MDRLSPAAYYGEDIATAQMRGAQLGRMRQQAAMEKAALEAEMTAYGVTDPRELLLKKATMGMEAAKAQEAQRAYEAKARRYKDFGDFMQDWEEMDPEYRAAALEDPGISSFLSEFLDPKSLSMEKEGAKFKASTVFPGRVMTSKGEVIEKGATKPGVWYVAVKTPKGEYFKETVGTLDKGADAATALQKNTSFIAKTLKIPNDQALQMALESKRQSKEAFVTSMIARATSFGGFNEKKAGEIREAAGKIYDSVYGDKETPEETAVPGGADWLGSVLEEE